MLSTSIHSHSDFIFYTVAKDELKCFKFLKKMYLNFIKNRMVFFQFVSQFYLASNHLLQNESHLEMN